MNILRWILEKLERPRRRNQPVAACQYRRKSDGVVVAAFRLDDPTAKYFAESPGYYIDPMTPADWWFVLWGHTGGHSVLCPRVFDLEYEALG